MPYNITRYTRLKEFSDLEEYDVATGLPTGTTKPNTIGDPDYIEPLTDSITCPSYFVRTEASLVLQSDFLISSIEKNCHTLDSNKDYIFTITSSLPVSYSGKVQYSEDEVAWTDIYSFSTPISSSVIFTLNDRSYLDTGYYRIVCSNGLKSNTYTTAFTPC